MGQPSVCRSSSAFATADAYLSILVQRRKVLHRLIGTTIEELYADRLAEHYETLAHHFERADLTDVELADLVPEGGRDWA